MFRRLRLARPADVPSVVSWRLHDGDEDLEVVGEANYQDALRAICAGSPGDRIRHEVIAVLAPEPDNPYDANAITVRIEGRLVGYLRRGVAAEYASGLRRLIVSSGADVALRGVIVGGGRPGLLGVRLKHNPVDFGVASAPAQPAYKPSSVGSRLHEGAEDLEVVGEANYQDALWALCGGSLGDRIRHEVVAVLAPEPRIPHDPDAITVRIEGRLVGYLPRDVAAEYASGLRQLIASSGADVALRGVIVGGGYRHDGPGHLGVWLLHDPADFGIAGSRRVSPTAGEMRTGLSEALRTDLEDDSYDLSWLNSLPDADRPAIAKLHALLEREHDLIDRHFQFAELESRLYHARDLYDAALDEFDDTCWQHDAEMDAMRAAFMAKWSKVPLLETYRQIAIRKQKQKDWKAVLWWCERGLAVYGEDAAREEAVEDLHKRRNRAIAKLEEVNLAHSEPRKPAPAGAGPNSANRTVATVAFTETLICESCQRPFDRAKSRGRKPRHCPDCR